MRFLWLLVALAIPTRAYADSDRFPFLAIGGLVGTGPSAGLEVSAGWFDTLANDSDDGPKGRDGFHFEPPFWIGGYGDVLYDADAGIGRVSFGPEIGCLIFGIDGGVVRELGGPGRWGLALRPALTFPVSLTPPVTFSLFARVEKWREGPSSVEIGLLVKYALHR